VTDHVQSRSVEIVSVPWPPKALKDAGAAAALTAQRALEGAVSEVSVWLHPKKPIAAPPTMIERSQVECRAGFIAAATIANCSPASRWKSWRHGIARFAAVGGTRTASLSSF